MFDPLVILGDSSLVGRTPDLQRLLDFVNDQNRKVAVLSARGGNGKTRILKALADELAIKSPDLEVQFVSQGIPIQAKDLDRLTPKRPVLVVVDDAHDRDDLPVLFAGAAHYLPHIKILLTTRPHGSVLIQTNLIRAGLGDHLLWTLEELSLDEVEALATEILTEHRFQAPLAGHIAEVTRDSPFMTVIGSSLVAKKALDPRLLANEDEFRRQLLARFEDVVLGNLATPSDRKIVRELLHLIALLQPIQDKDPDFQAAAEAVLDVPFDKISQQLRFLEDAGILLRRKSALRIVPDMLADYIVGRACFNELSGQPTGYADRVYRRIHGDGGRNLFIALSKLDWRLSANSDLATALLDNIWATLEQSFRLAGIFGRRKILKVVTPIAYYQPERALDLVHLALDEPTDSIEEPYSFSSWTRNATYAEVERALPPVLRNIAHTIEYLPLACDLLWKLAQRDDRDTHTSPDTALRVLRDLASIDLEKPRMFNERVVDCAMCWLSQPHSPDRPLSPFDVLDSVPATEGREVQTHAHSVAIKPYLINIEFVRPLRSRVIDAAFGRITAGDLALAVRAVKTVGESLRYPHGIFGQSCPEEIHREWSREFIAILQCLEETIRTIELDPVVLVEIRYAVNWHVIHGEDEIRNAAQAVLDAIPQTLSHRFTRGLIDPWGRSFEHGNLDVKVAMQHWQDSQTAVVRELVAAYSPVERISLLEERLTVLRAVRRYRESSPGFLVGTLVTASSEVGTVIMERLLAEPTSPTRAVLGEALAKLNATDPAAAVRFARQFLAVDDADLQRRVAFAYSWGLSNRHELTAEETQLIEDLVAHDDEGVRSHIVHGIANLEKIDRGRAVALLVSIDSSSSSQLTEDVLSLFSQRQPFEARNLTPGQRELVLARLRMLPSIDGYHIGQFFAALSEVAPYEVLALLTDRVERWEKEGPSDFPPFPYGWGDHSPLRFRESGAFEDVLRKLRHWAAEDRNAVARSFWSPQLFAAVARRFDDAVLAVLGEWMNTPYRDQIETVGRLLREAHLQFVWQHTDFVVCLLTAAWGHGKKSYRPWRELCTTPRYPVRGQEHPESHT